MAQTFSFPNYGLFNATYYLQQNPDVATSWTGTPLQHYISFGALEGRAPTAWFNADFYRASYPDLQSMNALQLFNHYCNYGFNEGRTPILNFSNFNGALYLQQNPDVAAAGYTPANANSHFAAYGQYEGRVAYANNGIVIQPVVNIGDTYTLTTGMDSILGTNLNDTFNASLAGANDTLNTLQTFDSLDGAGGTDTLNASLYANGAALTVAPVALNNLEIVNVTASSNDGKQGVTLNLVNAGQVTQVTNQASTDALTFNNIAANAALQVANTATATTFNYANTSGTADSANLTVQNATGGASITVDGIETINLTSSGTIANSVSLAGTSNTTVNISGANALTLAGVLGTTNINGTNMTGALTAALAQAGSLSGGSGNDSLTGTAGTDVITGNAGNDTITANAGDDNLSGGAGNDLFVLGANLTNADTINGGTDVDTLSATSAALTGYTAPTTATISNIEAVTVSNALAANLTLSTLQAGINTVNLAAGTGANSITFDSGVAGTVNIAAANTGALTVVSAGTGTTDALTINNTSGNVNVLAGNGVIATGVETLTLNLGSTTAKAQTTGVITGTSGTTAVVINGNNGVTTGVITGGSVNASGLTGTAALTIGAATVGVTSITGSANADTLVGSATATTIYGGAGNDIVTGGVAADALHGEAGDDNITGAGGNDTIDGGAGNDTITETVAGTVSIHGGEGDDFINIGNTLTTGDIIDGGTGSNTLAMSTALVSPYANVTNIQTLRLDAGAAFIQNLANFTGTTLATLNLNGNQGYTISGASANLANLGLLTATGTSTFARATDTSADALAISLTQGTTATSLTANNEETITVSTVGTGTGTITTLVDSDLTALNVSGVAGSNVTIGTLTAAAIETITITNAGDTSIANTAGTLTALSTVNASGATGNVTVNAGSGTDNITFTGGSGTAFVVTGSGADTLTAGSGIVFFNAGSGVDTITGSAGADVLAGGADGDIINVGSGTGDVLYYNAVNQSAVITSVATGQIYTNIDLVSGMAAADLVNVLGTAVTAGTAYTSAAAGATADGVFVTAVSTSALVNNGASLVRGDYNTLTGVWTNSGTGADTLFVYDQNALAAGTSYVAAVLVGVTGVTGAATYDAGATIVDVTLS